MACIRALHHWRVLQVGTSPTAGAATRRSPSLATRSLRSASWAFYWLEAFLVRSPASSRLIGQAKVSARLRVTRCSRSAVRQKELATAFGVHRALDTAGAMLGPLVAFGLLALAPGAFDAIFVVSFCVALIGLGVLTLFVENKRPDEPIAPAPAVSLREVTAAAATGTVPQAHTDRRCAEPGDYERRIPLSEYAASHELQRWAFSTYSMS